MPNASEVYHLALARGLHFRLVAPKEIDVEGPQAVMEAMNDLLEKHADGLVAIVGEWTAPASAAEQLLSLVPRRWGRASSGF